MITIIPVHPMKSKIAITLDSEILAKIEHLSRGQSRSAFIESLIRETINFKKLNTAVLLAGGAGTRLRPFTYEIPKPMIPIRGRPVIRWQIDILRKQGIRNIIVTLGADEKNNQIINEFGKEVTYVFEKEPLGTGGALLQVKDMVDGNFLVINADTLYSPMPNISGMYEFFMQKNALASLLVMLKEDIHRYGSVKLDGDGKIVGFNEKLNEKRAGLVSSGMYILGPEIFSYVKGKSSIENDIFPRLREEGRLFGYFFNGKTYDIGTLEGYEQAIKEWKP